jgi:hypothetical protein
MSSPANWTWRAGAVAGRAVVFDIDGVLSNASARQRFLDGPGRKDWKGFFDACGEDPLIEEVARLLALLDPDLHVVLLTGRPQRVRDLTRSWLEDHDLRWDLLIMRDAGDYGKAREFKERTVTELRDADLEPLLAFEDDRRNVEMFHEAGIPCIYIHSGYYE